MISEIVPEADAGDNIDRHHGLICPGFINAHCHLELSHMKGIIPKHTGLVDFVLKVVNERHFKEAEILRAIENAEDEMLENGIVAVGDICNNRLTIAQKVKGRLHYRNFIEASGFPPAVAEIRFGRAVDLYNAYSALLPSNSIVPHAPYSVSPQMFGMINAFPGNDLLTIHNQEVDAENELFEKGTGNLLRIYEKMGIDISFFKTSGKSSLQTFFPYFKKDQSLILVHNVCTAEKDLAFLKLQTTNHQPQIVFCLCPNANIYISNKLPDPNLFITAGCNIVLGTDSLASNDQLSILEEMKTLQNYFPSITLEMQLKWATINAAKALKMEEMLGSFERGKQPGVVVIEGTDGVKLSNDSSSKRIL